VKLVLSLFPGAGLLDRGFEQAGFCVVRGPDTVFGQRIEEFHAPASHFSGVIGGPPCQDFSRARRRPPTGHGLAMLCEFARVVTEARPNWFLIENVPGVPDCHIDGYRTQRFNLNAIEFGCRQSRNRSFQFGSLDGIPLTFFRRTQSHFGRAIYPTITTKDGPRNFADRCELQGLARHFDLPGLSRTAKIRAVGNGVPVPMARAVAEAIRGRGVTPFRLCACGCGHILDGAKRQKTFSPACRKRLERQRKGIYPRRIICLDESRQAQSHMAAESHQ
jgi:DNA (cytosine-5)-methyltransferase 1